jgi:hypothetical protein
MGARGQRDARADHEHRSEVGDRTREEPQGVDEPLPDGATLGPRPQHEAQQQAGRDQAEADGVERGLLQLSEPGQPRARQAGRQAPPPAGRRSLARRCPGGGSGGGLLLSAAGGLCHG